MAPYPTEVLCTHVDAEQVVIVAVLAIYPPRPAFMCTARKAEHAILACTIVPIDA
jgi:hypothetical protein